MILFQRILRYAAVSALLTLAAGCAHEATHTPVASFVIVNARIADGTGAPLRNASVRVAGDRIAAVGSIQPQADEPVLDTQGLVLAPGLYSSSPEARSTTKSPPPPISPMWT
jgi:adenine deaminase